jgi:hypothetical protein
VRRYEDGSVMLTREETAVVAKVLDLGQQLSIQLGANDLDEVEEEDDMLEVDLLNTIELLSDMGVSAESLYVGVDPRSRPM